MNNGSSNNGANVVGSALVVGGGIAGMQAALDLADAGIMVHLLEKTPWIGGRMAQLDKTFPTNDCAMCVISPRLVECSRHRNINIITNADLTGLDGDAGNFTATIRRRPRYVDEAKCTGCADCSARCPVKIPSTFNVGLSKQSAIDRAYVQAIPHTFAIQRLGVSPCKTACPAGLSAQGYVAMIAERRYEDALRVIMDRVPFPSICGRVCNRPCELACNRANVDEPVAIATLKRFVGDLAARDGYLAQEKPERTREERIAIIGSGPASLTATRDLMLKGFGVTMYEALPVAGGMLRVGIPAFRIPTEVVEREVQSIIDMGVDLRLNTRVENVNALLGEGFSAVLIAVGAHKGLRLPIPGSDLDGVHECTEMLRKTRLGNAPKIGKRVVVLGGGNVAFDAARTALRLGAENVRMAFLEPRDGMLAYEDEVRAGVAEGVMLLPSSSFTRILGEDGRVTGVECKTVTSFRFLPNGRLDVETEPESDHVLDCDTVIFAVGQGVELGAMADDGGVAVTPRGAVVADPDTMATERPGVFAAGDAVTGTSTIVEAIGAAHKAADAIVRYLDGENIEQPGKSPPNVVEFTRQQLDARVAKREISRTPRVPQPVRLPTGLAGDFDELELGYTEEEVVAEAKRCLDCAICSDCRECEIACGPGAIRFDDVEREERLSVGAVVMATGTDTYDARLSEEYGFGRYPNVVTSPQFERLLSASGPTRGHVLRPSDGNEPKRIAWLQCVGSRDQQHSYCSSVCCMSASKEAMLAKEHLEPGAELSIFQMDLRAYGKGFDAYFRRAEQEGVNYIRCRASSIKEDPVNRNLHIQYEDGNGEIIDGEFDMIVLSVGLEPSRGGKEAASVVGIGLDHLGFGASLPMTPLTTSRPGVFVCGSFRGPKDIPDSVTEASAVAAEIQRVLSDGRGTMVTPTEYPPETSQDGEEPRVGVFVCHCGTNIAGVVDVEEVAKKAKELPHVAHTDDMMFTCSTDSLARIREAIKEHKLNRVVVASCTPRTHEPLFQENMREAGLNPYLFEMANIRDQCSWVHRDDPDRATAKSMRLVGMSVARASHLEPLHQVSQSLSHTALVIGGGVAGMSAALNLAEQGYPTVLVEREPQLGGMLRERDTLDSGMGADELVADLERQVRASPRIEVLTDSAVLTTSGFVGNFKTTIAKRRDPTQRLIEHAMTVIATGGKEYRDKQYLLGQHPAVVTASDLEKAFKAGDQRIKQAKRIVFVQCVGPWDEQPFYCSRVCCSVTMKHVLKLKAANPSCDVTVLHKDVRTYGKKEEAYTAARQAGGLFVRYSDDDPPLVEADGERVRVSFNEPSIGERIDISADILVLSTAIVPSNGTEKLSKTFKLPLSREGFFQEAHSKLRPVDFASDGAFLAGVTQYPKSVEEAIIQGKAAAGRAARVLSKDQLQVGGAIATVGVQKCTACLTCVRICPYGVPVIQDGKARIEAAACQGCGACVAECPAKAIQLEHYRDEQVSARMNGLADLHLVGSLAK